MEEVDDVINVGASPWDGVCDAIRLPAGRLEGSGRAKSHRLGRLRVAVADVRPRHQRDPLRTS